MSEFVLLIVIGTSIWVYFDAKSIGVKKGQVKGVADMGPTGWFLACFFLWIVSFPVYLAKRGDFKRINQKTAIPQQPSVMPLPISHSPTQDFDEQLRKLAKLKQEDVISEDEFNQKKKVLLGI